MNKQEKNEFPDYSKEPIKDIEWQLEYNYMTDDNYLVPVCPSCRKRELPYNDNECVFCHQKIRWTEKSKEYEDIVAEYKDYKATQVYGSWGVYIEKNGKLLAHLSCSGAFTKVELLEMLKKLYELG